MRKISLTLLEQSNQSINNPKETFGEYMDRSETLWKTSLIETGWALAISNSVTVAQWVRMKK